MGGGDRGPEEGAALRGLVSFAYPGPPLAQVTGVEVRWEAPTGDFSSFSTRY